MHIPDGYLSPATCASLYAAATPFWYVALRRIRQELNTRTIPLVSLFSAFSFVVMMFNLPLPGGTTGHAVGIGIATTILGPWVSMISISMALLVQALLFGDGGITAFGANCFNMAIVGSLVAFGVYRVVARNAGLGSRRRVVAAGLAGYAAINVSALCAAIEFGIQPLWFHDASGAPLYAPYPLSISIPAMMIGHLTFAGLAELILSAGLVGYVQRIDPEMLRANAPDAPAHLTETGWLLPARARSLSPRLWAILGVFLLLTPLGLLSVGAAWGEWRAKDYVNPAARREMAAASQNRLPPAQAPAGLAQLSAIWKAPFSGYAPSFLRSASFGYFGSAVLGVGLIILGSLTARWFFTRGKDLPVPSKLGRRRRSFVEGTIQRILRTLAQALFAEDMANKSGLLQKLDARVKLGSVSALIVAALSVHRIRVLAMLFVLSFLLAVSSRIPVRLLVTRTWIGVLIFTGIIALPAIFITPGSTVFEVPILKWHGTQQGLTAAIRLILRTEIAATLSLVLILCTLWHRLLRALRLLRVPAVIVMLLETSYRYTFLLLQTAQNMFESRQTRMVGYLSPVEQRRFMGASAGVLLDKSIQLSGEVHAAMLARGFRGEIRLLDELDMTLRDWLQLAGFLAVAGLAIWIGAR